VRIGGGSGAEKKSGPIAPPAEKTDMGKSLFKTPDGGRFDI